MLAQCSRRRPFVKAHVLLALFLALPCSAADRVLEAFRSALTPEQSARLRATSSLGDLAAALTPSQKSRVRERLSRLRPSGERERARLREAEVLLGESSSASPRARRPQREQASHAAAAAKIREGSLRAASRLTASASASSVYDGEAERGGAANARASFVRYGSSSRSSSRPAAVARERGLTTRAVPSPEAGVAPVLALLRRSPTGREVADFLEEKRVPMRLVDIEEPGVSAYYDPDARAIEVPRDFSKKPLTEQAVLLGHEGYHAIQDLRDHAQTCLELEEDASVRHLTIYHEMLLHGAPPLPSSSSIARSYAAFRRSAREDRLQAVYDRIQTRYAAGKEDLALTSPVSTSLFSLAGMPYDFSAEPAAELRRHRLVRWIHGEQGLIAAERQHAKERRWAEEWLRTHRREL